MTTQRWTVPREAHGDRLDRFVARSMSISRSEAQRWIAEGRVALGPQAAEASARVREGDSISVEAPPPLATKALPESDVRFAVLHVDTEVVVVDKPAGLVVHPSRGHETGTLVNGLLALGLFSHESLQAQDQARPGIVHRLDKGTSGILVVARTASAREALTAQFHARTIERAYEAIVVGAASDRTFDTLHGRHPRDRLRFTTRVRTGKRAVTRMRVLAPLHGATHVECVLETGRTHQIRVHLADSGTPVLGDPLYGKPPRDERVRAAAEALGHQALHARVLGFAHPRTGEFLRFETAVPEDFERAIRELS
jgi:23S rRNA pseudouridine1911/1915/1917 synthase